MEDKRGAGRDMSAQTGDILIMIDPTMACTWLALEAATNNKRTLRSVLVPIEAVKDASRGLASCSHEAPSVLSAMQLRNRSGSHNRRLFYYEMQHGAHKLIRASRTGNYQQCGMRFGTWVGSMLVVRGRPTSVGSTSG
jgi:hypothetical protein